MATSVGIIVGYAVLYAVIHSWTASGTAKDWARRAFGPAADRWYRLVYNAVSAVLLLPFAPMLLWLPDRLLYTLSPPWLWLALLGQMLALLGVVYGIWQTDAAHFLGLRQWREGHTQQLERPQPRLVISGPYRLVRHPLYFFGLVFIWLTPQMTVNRLALAIVLSAYLYVGTFFEERRLVREFGDAYRQYQQRVPRMLPGMRVARAPRPLHTPHDKP